MCAVYHSVCRVDSRAMQCRASVWSVPTMESSYIPISRDTKKDSTWNKTVFPAGQSALTIVSPRASPRIVLYGKADHVTDHLISDVLAPGRHPIHAVKLTLHVTILKNQTQHRKENVTNNPNGSVDSTIRLNTICRWVANQTPVMLLSLSVSYNHWSITSTALICRCTWLCTGNAAWKIFNGMLFAIGNWKKRMLCNCRSQYVHHE